MAQQLSRRSSSTLHADQLLHGLLTLDASRPDKVEATRGECSVRLELAIASALQPVNVSRSPFNYPMAHTCQEVCALVLD